MASRDVNPTNQPSFSEIFRQASKKTAELVGTPTAFLGAVLVILIWGGSGPLFHYSDTWQLVVNTATTIITFLMVFLIQNTQNRDSRAIHVKLDELIPKKEPALDDFRDSLRAVLRRQKGQTQGMSIAQENQRVAMEATQQAKIEISRPEYKQLAEKPDGTPPGAVPAGVPAGAMPEGVAPEAGPGGAPAAAHPRGQGSRPAATPEHPGDLRLLRRGQRRGVPRHGVHSRHDAEDLRR